MQYTLDVLSAAVKALERQEWRQAEAYLLMLPVELHTSARETVNRYRNASAAIGASNPEVVLLMALYRETDQNRSGKPPTWVYENEKVPTPAGVET